MIIVFAFALMIAPLVVLYLLERAARKGTGPLADPDRLTVLDGMVMLPTMVPTMTPMVVPTGRVRAEPGDAELMDARPVFAEPVDPERCAEESRLVRKLLDGDLNPAQYQTEMATLAAGRHE